MNLRLRPLDYMVFALDGGINPGAGEITQARATITLQDPRPITRRSLDLDFMRPNSVSFGYRYLINGPNGFLALNANITWMRRTTVREIPPPGAVPAPPIPKASSAISLPACSITSRTTFS